MDGLVVHLLLLLIAPALLVSSGLHIDIFEVLLGALDAVGLVDIVGSVWLSESLVEGVGFHHLENKTIAEAVTTVSSAQGWHISGPPFAEALEVGVLHEVLGKVEGLVVAFTPLTLVGSLLHGFPLSHLLESVKFGTGDWVVQQTVMHDATAFAAACLSLGTGITAIEDLVPRWKLNGLGSLSVLVTEIEEVISGQLLRVLSSSSEFVLEVWRVVKVPLGLVFGKILGA